jgi:nitrite reductase (cytochrome c-552)
MPARSAPRLPRLLARRWLVVAIFLAAGVGFVAGAGAYTFVYAKGASYLGTDSSACANCHIRRAQARGEDPFFRVVELTDETEDPAGLGQEFSPPVRRLQAHGRPGPHALRRQRGGPEGADLGDPRSVVAQSKARPRSRASRPSGTATPSRSTSARSAATPTCSTTRLFTERQKVAKQPGTCLHCHASSTPLTRRLGGGDLIKGFEAVNPLPYTEARKLVSHPVACIDCHDPPVDEAARHAPRLHRGHPRLKASQGVPNYDVNTRPRHQEDAQRTSAASATSSTTSRVPKKRLVVPLEQGHQGRANLSYYDRGRLHSDWTHKDSGAKVLKAQHPEFEMWSQGIHARSGVACADCHMPYKREGALKVTDHHIRSPLLNINRGLPDLPPLARRGS